MGMSEKLSLDNVNDNISDDASFSDLMSAPEESYEKVVDAQAPLPAEPLEEESYEAADDVEYDEVQDTPEDSPDEELVEVEWYGEKGKISKGISDYLNKKFTETQQKNAAERRAWEQELAAREAQFRRQLEEYEARRANLQAHLDANPDFAESWQAAEAPRRQGREIEQLRQELSSFREEQSRQAEEARLTAELAHLANKYQVSDPVYTPDRVAKLAAAEVFASNFEVPLEHAYQNIVREINAEAKRSKFANLKGKVAATKESPTASTKKQSRARVRKQDPSKMSLDDLLKRDLARPDEFFER